ncbi:LysM peptidoglycan-binding domain-containing protein [Kribbella albertanoniae]|nr:LysM peptidoglycan-binding domain-containing protein [Kribbella albertanoniae]
MLRGVKSLLAIGALGAVGVALRWVTAGTITAANSHDLDSLTVLAVGGVAWVAYGWLVLAVLATALEQLPGALGAAAGAVAARITSTTSRALLRSALGVAAVTPLTVGVAHAASPHGWPAPQSGTTQPAATWRATEPRSTVQLTGNIWRTTEPQPSVEVGGTRTHSRATEPRSSEQIASNVRTTEPRSTMGIDGARDGLRESEPRSVVEKPAERSDFRATEPRSAVEIDANRTTLRATEPRSAAEFGARSARSGQQAGPRNGVRAGAGVPQPRDSDVRPARQDAVPVVGGVQVPDRPEVGAATRYTDLRSGRASRVTVAAGDTLWDLAARELGVQATNQEIAARWPQWYAANRQLIGADPNLILPGQVLRVPPTHKEQ